MHTPRGDLVAAAAFVACVVAGACSHLADDYDEWAKNQPVGGAGGAGGGGAGGQGGSTGGTGGTDPCGGCGGSTPYCDAINGLCEACLEHAHCTDAAAAQCDGGDCVPCTAPEHCAGVADAELCESGTCVECTLQDDSACGTGETCNLVDFVCVEVGAESVGNCGACTNDAQCGTGFRCIAMGFEQAAHGYYCLEEDTGSNCIQPFGVPISSGSINGAAATEYCGIAEDYATCEAVLALLAGWVCSGAPEMCGAVNQPEEHVPGALCRNILGTDRCTYACGSWVQCLPAADAPLDNCAGGIGGSSPDYCGG